MFSAEQHLGEGSPLAGVLPGFRRRPGQVRLAQDVWATFAGEGHLVAEAGTGVGKSLAYLVPAAFAGRRVVVSTATKALQEQLMRQDVPLASAAVGRTLDAAIVKGRASYVCRALVAESGMRIELDQADALVRLDPWLRTTRTGDRDELDWMPPASLWRELSVGPDRCRGGQCAERARCFAEGARLRAQSADIVLVNHALYLADLALRASSGGGFSVLPEHDLVVFDEAHALEDAAADALGLRLSNGTIARLAQDVAVAARMAQIDVPELALTRLRIHADALFGALPGGARVRLRAAELGRIPVATVDGVRAALGELAESLRGTGEEADALARHAERQALVLESVLRPDEGRTVLWSERDPRGSVELRSAPVDVSEALGELLFDALPGAVLVSATLATHGGLTHVRERLGIREARELVVPCPFDAGTRARLHVPHDAADGGGPTGPDARIAAGQIERLCHASGGRALVLFTSYRRLHLVHDLLRDRLPFPLLRQGDAPRDLLLQRFRDEVDSVLFASLSFWQGVDVPGEALSLVIVDRLPFAPPDDPLVAGRSERATQEGRSAFSAVQLPRAALLLKQAFGRLLRTDEDAGVVAVLDRRLLTRGYGRAMRDVLPPAPLVEDAAEIAAFLGALRAGDQAVVSPASATRRSRERSGLGA